MAYRILVPIDFSPESERAFAWAAELQRAGDVEAIDAIFVLNPFPTAMMAAPIPMPTWSDDDLGGFKSQVQDTIARHHAKATAEVVLALNVGDAIVGRARTTNATLIVMGTHGRGGLRRLALGSVAEYVVRHADCPVVTLRATAATPAHAAA